MHGLAKTAARLNGAQILNYGLAGLGALATAKVLHTGMVEAEPDQDIRVPLTELESRKEKMQAVRTAFQDQFKDFDVPEVDGEKTDVSVGRSMFPWRDRYDVHIQLDDKDGKPISDWTTYDADVYKDKDKNYTGYVNMVFTRDDMQGKGIGRKVENKMVNAFQDLGATKARLMPAFDGPLVWAKKDFGYNLSPDSKKTFLKAYQKYTKEKGIPFQDLGDTPSDYPQEFLKDLKKYEPTWGYTYYEKPLAKTAGVQPDPRLVEADPEYFNEILPKVKPSQLAKDPNYYYREAPLGRITGRMLNEALASSRQGNHQAIEDYYAKRDELSNSIAKIAGEMDYFYAAKQGLADKQQQHPGESVSLDANELETAHKKYMSNPFRIGNPNLPKMKTPATPSLAKVAGSYKKKRVEIQHGYNRNGVDYGVTISKDRDGYFCHTHRARSKSYDDIEQIPLKDLKFIDSTG